MSEDLTLFSSPELKDVVQDVRELLSRSRLAVIVEKVYQGGELTIMDI